MQKYNSRKEVPEEYKWDLTAYFKDEKEFVSTYERVFNLTNELKGYVGCTKDAYILYEFLKKQTEAFALLEDLYAYSILKNDQELGISENISRKNKVEQLGTLISTEIAFFAPELLKLTEKEYNELYEKNSILKEFKANLDKIYREKEHVLSEREEIIISELTETINSYEDMAADILDSQHDYGKIKIDDDIVTISTNNFGSLMRNDNQSIRKKIYKQYNSKLEQYSGTNAGLLNNFILTNTKLAKIRNYKSAWDEHLYSLNLNDKIFKMLVNTTEKNLVALHKYYKLKCDMLNLEKLNMYDIYLELTKSKKEYSIKEAQEIIRKSLLPLGDEYIARYDKVIEERHIDYCQYHGKCSGGYSIGTMLQDSRIMMNFNYDLNSVSTIAHEAGHDINLQFIKENNLSQYVNFYPLVAEVASLTNECLLANYLMNNGKTKEERLSGIYHLLRVITSNLFGAVREGKMEQDMYNHVLCGGTINKEFMDNLAKKTIKKYYGKFVKLDKYSKNDWVVRTHYYRNFYLYSYAICMCVAVSISEEILKGNEKVLNNYYEFLKVGCDKWPSEAFAVLGVDLEDSKIYETAIRYYDNLIEKYYEIYNQKEV